jgi:hypothetical protein
MQIPEQEIKEFFELIKKIKPKFESEEKALALVNKLENKLDQGILDFIFCELDPNDLGYERPVALQKALEQDKEDFGTEPRAAIDAAIQYLRQEV